MLKAMRRPRISELMPQMKEPKQRPRKRDDVV